MTPIDPDYDETRPAIARPTYGPRPLSIEQDPGFLGSAAGTGADYLGRLQAKRLMGALEDEDLQSAGRAYEKAKYESALDDLEDPQNAQLGARKRDLEYERLLPYGTKSHIGMELSHPPESPMPRAPLSIERPLGGPTIGEYAVPPKGSTGLVDQEVEGLTQRARARGLSEDQIQKLVNEYYKQRVLHGALSKGDYGTAGRIMYPEDFGKSNPFDQLGQEPAVGR